MRKYAVFIVFISISVTCSAGSNAEEYSINESREKSYKIMYVAQNWTISKENCEKDGAKLAVPKSKDEFLFIQQMVRRMHYPDIIGAKYKYLVWLGINNLEDYRVWKNIDGENINDTGFHDWAGMNGQDPRPDPKEPHCVGMDAHNPGLRDFWCHLAQPFVCEKKILS